MSAVGTSSKRISASGAVDIAAMRPQAEGHHYRQQPDEPCRAEERAVLQFDRHIRDAEECNGKEPQLHMHVRFAGKIRACEGNLPEAFERELH